MVNVLSNSREVCVYCSGKWMDFLIYKLHLNHSVKSRTVHWQVSPSKISLGLPPHLGIKYKPRLMTNKWFFPRDWFVRIRWPCRIKGRRKGRLRLTISCLLLALTLTISVILCMCVCRACVWCSYAHICAEVTGQPWMLFLRCHLGFQGKTSYWPRTCQVG